MNNSATQNSAGGPPAAHPPDHVLLHWRSIPATRAVRTTIFVVILIIGLPVVLGIWYGAFYGLLAILILGGSLLSFFLPSDFILTEQHITRRYLGIDQSRKWSEFRSYYPDKNGVLLSPFALPSRLENFRGMYVRFENNREQVLAVVAARLSSSSPEKPR